MRAISQKRALSAIGVSVIALAGTAGAAQAKTIKFTSITKSEIQTSKSGFVDIDVDKAGGKKIGADVLSGQFNRKTRSVHIDVAVALDGGMLFGSFDLKGEKKHF